MKDKWKPKEPGEIIQNWFWRFHQLIKDNNPGIKVDDADSCQFLAIFCDALYFENKHQSKVE